MASSRKADVTEQMVMDERLTHRDLRVLLALLLHCDAAGSCWLKRESISRVARVPQDRVSVATTRLARFGWIEKVGVGGRGVMAQYLMSTPETLTESVRVSDTETLTDKGTLSPETLTDKGTLYTPETLTESGRVSPETLTVSGRVSESYPQPLLSLRDKENTEEEKRRNPPPPFSTKDVEKPAAKGIPHEDLFDQAWQLAREVNRVVARRCKRKESVARWTAKCRERDAAETCLECWELEVASERVKSGLEFQRGFQVYLNGESWTEPHALEDLRAAKHNTENGNERTNGNGARPRRESSVERYDRAHRAYFDRAIAEEEREERELAARTFDAEPENH